MKRNPDPLLYLRTAVLTLRQTSLPAPRSPLPFRLLISPENNGFDRHGPLGERARRKVGDGPQGVDQVLPVMFFGSNFGILVPNL